LTGDLDRTIDARPTFIPLLSDSHYVDQYRRVRQLVQLLT